MIYLGEEGDIMIRNEKKFDETKLGDKEILDKEVDKLVDELDTMIANFAKSQIEKVC